MKRYVYAAKEPANGIFWYIDDEDQLLCYPFGSVYCPGGIAKSGDTYNHKKFWNDLKPKGNKYSYNYYPRGRVAIYQGIAFIHLNSRCNTPNVVDTIVRSYNLDKLEIELDLNDTYQGSHYDFQLS